MGMEGMWVKMFDPPKESPATPDLVAPTNPVPEVLAAAGYQTPPLTPHTVVLDLMHGIQHDTWDLRPDGMQWFLFANDDAIGITNDEYPTATLRCPQGVVFHCETSGKGPPPHTIHWHGLEPTPHNDGVGHCSMELGHYVYQFQPQFIGTYFSHCHRNTVQHFEFGLFFFMLIEPKDAYFATQANPAIPIGHCRDGRRRTAANLSAFPQFLDFNPAPITDLDPWTGNPVLKFDTNPHANTVAYDVEALWVLDDRDSAWSDLANNARQTYPAHGTRPGFDDHFHTNADPLIPALPTDFFAFNDFHADYWYVTGVPVEARRRGSYTLPPNIEIPATLNSGVSGSQVSIRGLINQTILVRCLCAAYNSVEVSFPMDVVVIAWDGRALGVAPFGRNHAYTVPAGTPINMTTARRFDLLIRVSEPINSTATVKFFDTRGQVPGDVQPPVMTARIPIEIGHAQKIVAAAGPHGMVTPLGTVPIAHNGSRTYTVTPDPGYAVAGLVVDGVNLPAAASHTFSFIQNDHSISAFFTPIGAFTVRASAGPNGSITPLGETSVGSGASLTYNIIPNAGFIVSALVVDGVQVAAATSYTFSNITANHSISVSFAVANAPTGTIVINNGATFTRSQSVSLTLTATATVGSITLMQFSKDGVNYFPFEPFKNSKVATLPSGDGVKTIWVKYRDSLGNVSGPASASITLDATVPVGSIAINGGALVTNNRRATVSLTASPDVSQMQFSWDGVTYYPWEPFTSTRIVTLPAGDGQKTLWVRFRDAAGNVSAPLSDNIGLDTTKPTGTIAFNPPVATTTAASATLALSAGDPVGVTQMQFSRDGLNYYPLEPFATSRTVALVPGSNTLTVRFKDAAGNLSDPISASITRN